MAVQSFEDQAALLRRLAGSKGNAGCSGQLQHIAAELDRLGTLRRKCMEGAAQGEDISDALAADLLLLLRLPTE